MPTLNISLPESMREFIGKQVAEGKYATASEYVRGLIRQAQKQAAREWLEAELLKGLDSGPPKPMTAKDWEDIRKRAMARINAKQKSAK